MVYLTRKCEFSASHYYHNPEFTAEENQRVFGKCANLNGHGHNYTLEVTVKGEVDPKTGFVVDLKELKEILNRECSRLSIIVISIRKFRNSFTRFPRPRTWPSPFGTGCKISSTWRSCHRVRVYELPDLFVDFYGEA